MFFRKCVLSFDKVATKNKTPAQAFSCEYCKIFKNSFFYRKPLVVASCRIRTKSLKLEKFEFQLFLTYNWYHGVPLHCDIIVVKRDTHLKISLVESIHIAKTVQWYVLNRRSFEIVFWIIWVLRIRLILTYNKKIVWQFDVGSHVLFKRRAFILRYPLSGFN